MTVTNDNNRSQYRTAAGDHCPLDIKVEPGLFEDADGNRYLVLSGEPRLAIILHHQTFERFTWQKLGKRKLAQGRWWGWPRLRLSHALTKPRRDCHFGLISVEQGDALMCLRSPDGGADWFVIGSVADPACDCDFDGWILDSADVRFPFFECKPRGRYVLGQVDVSSQFEREISVEIMNTHYVSYRI